MKLLQNAARIALGFSVLHFSSSAFAAGFYLQEQSVTGLGTAFAGMAANPEDASTVYYNPAGMAALKRAQAQIGVHMLMPRQNPRNSGSSAETAATGHAYVAYDANNGGNPYDTEFVPNAYVAFPVSKDVWLGFGVSAPFGLANQYKEGWFGRYDSTSSDLRTIEYAPSIAWKICDRLSIGGGANVQSVTASLDNAIPSPSTAGGPKPSTDGKQNLSGEDVATGFNIGLLWEPVDGTRIGAHYRGEVDHLLKGRAIITNPLDIPGSGGKTSNIGGQAPLTLPDIATLSLAQDLTERLTLLASTTWYGWSDYARLHVELDNGSVSDIPQNYNDTVSLAIGLRYQASDDWILRAGYQYDPTPTQDGYRSTRTPDGDRNWFAAGVSYRASDNLSLDLSGTYISIADESIDLTRSYTTGTAHIQGRTGGETGILSAGLRWTF